MIVISSLSEPSAFDKESEIKVTILTIVKIIVGTSTVTALLACLKFVFKSYLINVFKILSFLLNIL